MEEPRKGRDWPDLIRYAARDVRCHLPRLAARMTQTGRWEVGKILTPSDLKKLLEESIATVDFPAASADVRPFLADSSELDLWSADFFREIAARITG